MCLPQALHHRKLHKQQLVNCYLCHFYLSLGKCPYLFGQDLHSTVGMLCMFRLTGLQYMYTVDYITCHSTTRGHSHIPHKFTVQRTLNADNLSPPHSAHSSSFLAFWRRRFKRESTELKEKDHDSSELGESKDDKLSDPPFDRATEPTETASYRLVCFIHLKNGYECKITCWG